MWSSLARSWDSSVCIGRRRRRRSSQHRVRGTKCTLQVNLDAKGFFNSPRDHQDNVGGKGGVPEKNTEIS